ncbi:MULTISPECIES: helix-turn-helix transcriptional regulator [unclassified Corallococcus]|uniref:helix-turn-helix transcriptional regulator n=1 Tax=unclassified Corallococcus TaxID=2685029 RepID=UPI001A8D782C|nr:MULTISPECIES: helix-turn-helix transcriptional regulator [unclassified Corallococcus]MBN9686490.1 LuxR family transcriptional regulator [Corallococcus sp. NCSPR001]WAS82082.1 LuxR C-terminal-related transcriptional regulator [Corallococcus sp. NCRR]
MNLTAHEQGLVLELTQALASSLDLTEVLARAQGVLTRLLPCDYAALCVSRPERPGDYEWMGLGAPGILFAHYPELASDLVSRKELKRHLLYLRCREMGLPLEHVLAVLLDLSEGWHGGFTLYREHALPFSEREQALLEDLTPYLANTVRNCRLFGHESTRGDLLDALFRQQGAECVVMDPPEHEKLRTPGATELLRRWYPEELKADDSRLPQELRDHLARLQAVGTKRPPGMDTWTCSGAKHDLKVTFVELPEQRGHQPWGLVLQECTRALPIPEPWRQKLSPREVEVVQGVLSNWTNELIAEDLGLTLNTVKTHLRNIFPKLGIESRTDLLYQAARRQKPG